MQVETLKPAQGGRSLKWFMCSQNNSGSTFEDNDEVCELVAFQAGSAEEAMQKAEAVCGNYEDYCPCCGPRWYYYVTDEDGTDVPEVYGVSVFEAERYFSREKCILYYADGKVERVTFKKKGEK